MAEQLDIIEGISDDMSIAQGLLGRPNIPLRLRTSITSTTRSGHTVEVWNEGNDSTGTKDEGRRRRMVQSSNTWTTSSGEALSELDDVEDRTFFVNEYNRLATKHGVRTLTPEDPGSSIVESGNGSDKSGSWFSRKILRRTSSTQSVKTKNDRLTKHRRSISDLSLRLKSKSDTLKDKDLQELVRLCGLSLLYLPTEYAASNLAVPTCFRATAQYLVQHASTARGVFRIPGSHNVVASLYNHYCTMDNHGEIVAGTVRCPTLPEHIRCDVHDVASAFKKFISGLPGGILGSLPLLDAFISIQSQLNGVPELTRTKQSKVRARLIALAIATLRSQYRRELICAVFGLLSMIGRAAEIAPRENDRGRPLPTSDLMGYGPLGIVFGPLLVGDMLENYTMRLANPRGGLVLLPISPPKSRTERRKKNKTSEDRSSFNSHVDKIKIANSITEMLITHWRDVVRHMRSLKALKIVKSYKNLEATGPKQPFLRPSASESFALRKPPDWDNDNSPIRQIERYESPTPAGRGGGLLEGRFSGRSSPKSNDTLTVRKHRSRPRPMSSQMLSGARSMSILSPTMEENLAECALGSDRPSGQECTSSTPRRQTSVTPPAFTSATSPRGFLFAPPVRIPSTPSIRTSVTQPTQSYQAVYPFSDNPGIVNTSTYDELENTPSKDVIGDGSHPLQEHKLKDCPPKQEFKEYSPAANPKHSFAQTRLMGPRQPEPLAQRPPFPAITISTVPSSGQAKPGSDILRRISASEPALRAENPIRHPFRPSISTYGDSAHRIAVRDWATSKDPLARVSVAEDLASLAALAHVLEDEPAGADPSLSTSENTVVLNSKQLAERYAQYDLENLASKVAGEEARAVSKEKYDALTRRTVGELLQSLKTNVYSKKSFDRPPLPDWVVRPRAIEGPNYSHLSGRMPSPKKSPEGPSRRSGSPANVKHSSSLVSSQIKANDAHIDKTEVSVNESPRVSVRALAAKFNNCDSRSLSSPSPTKSPSKAASVDVRAVSDSSPKEKIIAPYTTNPPSPTKSQKSGKSDVSLHSVRIPPHLERNFAKHSPPRKLLRSDLNDSTPLRSVRKLTEEAAASAKEAPTLNASDPPACCSPPGSLQRPSLYDGASNQYSRSASSDPIQCSVSPRVHFEPRRAAAAASEKIVTTSYVNEPSSIPMAIKPLTSPHPTRSNSLLHAQIRNLQQQLNNKTEEIRHLKQQVSTRGKLDIAALSGELREAKGETQTWKCRAEVAEKQLEVMATLSTRNTRHNAENLLSMAGHSTSSPSRTAGYSEDGAVVSERIRALRGMDGASSHPSSSEGSTETVVREIREEAITGSEYGMWVEHTMNAIEFEFMAAQNSE